MSDSDDEEFGATVPPLSKYIQGILERYPDGSQILKELLQNAEDAGATQVKFLYDTLRYSQQNLFQENLSCCQGPAIIAYNNAQFQPCDWKGIQQPQRSHKADNVLKVGKFGIGFNSVYHLTDMPWILSGEKLAVMEPTETLFNGKLRNRDRRRSGFEWKLDKQSHQEEIRSSWNQFVPIDQAARAIDQNRGGLYSWKFDGTLFRLPLRTKPSIIKENIYSDKEVGDLFASFSEELSDYLVFLCNIESIDLLGKNNDGVSILSEDVITVRQKRKILETEMKKVAALRESNKTISNSLNIDLSFRIKEKLYTDHCAVSHFLPSHSTAPATWKLEKNAKRLPWVSVATKDSLQNAATGRVFCFLPLPKNPENMTGLPVHINAYFGLDDNRRNLKWPSGDQSRDPDAQWNLALLEEVIPHAYVQLINFHKASKGDESYKLWPEIEKVRVRWQPMLKPFFQLLFQHQVLKISSTQQWVALSASLYIADMSTVAPKVSEAVFRCLDKAKTPYVRAPKNVLDAIKQYGPKSIRYVTPELVKDEFTKVWTQRLHIDGTDRLYLLEYFVNTSLSHRQAAELIYHQPIIPLTDGNYCSMSDKPLYLASDDYKELLPSMQDSIINLADTSNEVDKLLEYVSGLNWITRISRENFPTILRSCLPSTWTSQKSINCNLDGYNFPNRTWLSKLWKHLENEYPRSLSEFAGLTLLECQQLYQCSNLVALPREGESFLFIQGGFPQKIEKMLGDANAIAVPARLLNQHSSLTKYIHQSDINGLANLMKICQSAWLKASIAKNPSSDKDLVLYLAKNINNIPTDIRNIVKDLPLFQVYRWPLNSTATHTNPVSVSDYSNVSMVTFDGLPSQLQTNDILLDCRTDDYYKLAHWLGVKLADWATLAMDVINNKNKYNIHSFSALMDWCLDYVNLWNVKSSLQDFAFVPSDDNYYHAPCQLFDPNVAELKNLFYEESGRFPNGNFATAKGLDRLRGLGLRSRVNDITGDEIMKTARIVAPYGSSYPSKRDAFIQILQSSSNKLTEQQFVELRSLKLFQAQSEPPADYSPVLPWFGKGKEQVLYSATELADGNSAHLVGSVIPILGTQLPQTLIDRLGIAKSTMISEENLVLHLKTISEHYHTLNDYERNSTQNIIYKVYSAMSMRSNNHLLPILNKYNFKNWICVGTKFVAPTEVVANLNFINSLEPYVYSIPSVFSNMKVFFIQMGIIKDDGPELARRVLQEIVTTQQSLPITESKIKQDLQYVINILQVIANNLNNGEDVLIPIKHSRTYLKFKPASACKYNDSVHHDFLDNDNDEEDEEDDIILTHSALPIELCRILGASPLSNAVLDAEEFEQHESMVGRLKGVLEEYPAGATIFQELIQNADDAGAKEIGFLLDMRENANWRKSILWPGMDQFQGPALWVYNNALFSDDDFKNILKVGGRTKRADSDKIGSFGIGFNSIYHLTDMPCFVSGDYLAILDPQKRCVPRTAGVRLNLQRKTKKLETYSDQFRPYQDVYGCDLSYKRGGASFRGTLFRLPLRNSVMAKNSELSTSTYDLFQMKSLLQKFTETQSYGLLFIKDVKELTVKYLPSSHSNPVNAQILMTIQKTEEPTNYDTCKGKTVIQAVKESFKTYSHLITSTKCNFVSITITNNHSSDGFSLNGKGTTVKNWLVLWNAENNASYKLAVENQDAGLMPAVAIAVNLQNGQKKPKVEPVTGLAFCYLPLPVETGLPFHVQAAFALGSNRRHLWTENEKDLTGLKTQWNEVLKNESLVTCFIKQLGILKGLDVNNYLENYSYFAMWPIHGKVCKEFCKFLEAVYRQLCTTEQCLWKTEDGRWISFGQSRFLTLSDEWPSEFREAAQQALQVSLGELQPDCGVVSISSEIRSTLQAFYSEQLQRQTYTDETFLRDVFFPNLHLYDSDLANKIILHVITASIAQKPFFRQLLHQNACIPTMPGGNLRRRPCELIDKRSEIHKLYYDHEQKFAFEPFQQPEILDKLVLLGMNKQATGEILLDRANTIQSLMTNLDAAKFRSNLILQNLANDNIDDSWYDKFQAIPFMFSLPEPEKWSSPWYRTENGRILFSPKELFSKKHFSLICFVAPIWDDQNLHPAKSGKISHVLKCNRTPPVSLLIEQLSVLENLEQFPYSQFEMLQRVSSDCIKILQDAIKKMSREEDQTTTINALMATKTLIFPSAELVPYEFVCYRGLDENYTPYIFSIKDTVYEASAEILQKCGIKNEFSKSDYIDALKRMKKEFGSQPLPENKLRVAIHLCVKLHDCLSEDEIRDTYKGELLLPDLERILTPSSELVFWELDITEVPEKIKKEMRLCNTRVLRDVALKLGVRLQRTMLAERFYKPFPHGEAFGQHEDITTRIQNILNEYDGGSDVINEMIQNADDAGATEIRFILDQRQLPTDGQLLSDTWAELQGPALIVYNNRPFEDKDLRGIQSLGMGSKRSNPEMTGKFGIGFNTVYRLTDVPMFISNREKLCVLDPHRLYAPTATEKAPGGIFDLDPDFIAMYSNVLKGFYPTNDLKTKQSTIFRLPLRTKTQVASSKIGNKEVTSKDVLDMLHTFEARAEDSLFFLKNIEKIHLTYKDEQGKWRNSTFSAHLSEEDKKEKIKFLQAVAKNEPLDNDLTVMYKTTICVGRSQHSEWLILQCLSCMKNNVQENLSQLRERKKLIASPLVGIAVQLQGKNKECRTYTTLPLPGNNKLPVHINGKFMLDQGRKQCHLHDDDSYKIQWNHYLIRYVLAPLYIKALEYLKNKLIEDWDESFKGDRAGAVQTQNYLLKFFQAHLPPTRNTEKLGKLLLHQVYALLFRDKLKLLCSVVFNTHFQQQLLWLSVPDGIIDNLKEEEKAKTVILSAGAHGQTQNKEPTKLDFLREILQIVHFPTFHRHFNVVVYEIYTVLEIEPKAITPDLVAQHMKEVKDSLIVKPTLEKEKLPIQFEKTVLNYKQICSCLRYILKNEQADLNGIPLLLTADNELRRFSEDTELYESNYTHLLPTQRHLFCNYNLYCKLPERFCKKFTVSTIATHLHEELPDLNGKNKVHVSDGKIKPLIHDILKFLANLDYKKNTDIRSSISTYIAPLKDWALLPVAITENRYTEVFLVPLSKVAKVVFTIKSTSDTDQNLYNSLHALGCMLTCIELVKEKQHKVVIGHLTLSNLSSEDLSPYITFFSKLCASAEEPETILKVLYDVAKHDMEQANFNCIGRDDRLALLNYLLEHQSHLIKSDTNHVKMMKLLPLFETLDEQFVSLISEGPTYTYVMCNESIERQDLGKLKDLKQVVVLGMKLVDHEDLCKTLDLLVLNGTDLYKRYIIPCMPDFTLRAIIRHMHWVKCNLIIIDDGLRNSLGSALLFTTCSGQRKALRGLYSRKIKHAFGDLLPEDQFIPKIFWQTMKELYDKRDGSCSMDFEYEWEPFLIRLGLKDSLSKQDFFELAEKLQSKEGSISHEKLEEISKQLVYYLENESEWHKDDNFLNRVSKTKFVLAHSVSKELNTLHQQDSVFKGLICYHDGVPEIEEKICWTVKKLLPSWATFYSYSRKNILKALGIRETLEVEDVVAHLGKVCSRLQSLKKQERTGGINSREAITSLRSVQEASFRFFGTHLEKLSQHIELLERTKKIPCVLVEEGKKMVCPNQVVTEKFTECPPFLYTLPEDSQYGFIRVLKTLGTETKITHTHYILALNMFHDKYGDQQIVNPNFKKTLQHVYLGFLSQIMQVGPEKVTEEILYLPDEDLRMQKSTDIFISLGSKHPNIEGCGKLWNTLIVAGKLPLNKCSDALMHLPNIIRPLSLREFVSETFCEESPCCQEEFHGIAYDIGRLFHSELFARVITQLINAHDLHTKNAPAKQDELSALFSTVVVKCYKEVKIQMFEKGTNNPVGEKTVAMFLKKTAESDEVNILVAHDQSVIKDAFIEILVSLIKLICPFKSQKEAFNFAMMLQVLNVSKQTESLNEIRKTCLNEENCDETFLPQVGDVVPEDVAALLDQNPLNYYNEFDFVACEVQSENAGAAAEGNEPESMYIYGQIVKEVENADDSEGILKWYQVKLSPGEPVEKSSLDIYKFLPMKELKAGIVDCSDLACLEDDIDGNDANGSNKFSQTEQETMDKISDQLESFWRLPPNDRRKAIKRLYLYWHPDKNPPEQKKFCHNMFVHIKQEIDRLEKGLPRTSKKSDPDSKDFCSSWNSDFNNWNRQAGNDKRRRKNYNKRAGKSGGFFASSMRSSGIPPSFATSCHPAAKLWCQQAKHDMDAAIHQAGSAEPLYEWIYYQYYEVARKSLNAMILTRSPRVSQSANLKELLLNVLESFGNDPGDVHKTVQLLLKNQVDDILPLKPIGGKTPHQNYQPYGKCCKEVGDAAMKLLKLAEDLIAKTNRSD